MSARMQFLTFKDFANSKNGSQSSVQVKRLTPVIRMHFLPLVVATFIKDLLIVWLHSVSTDKISEEIKR